MSIRLTCSDCDKPLKVKDELAGKRIRCPGCQSIIRVPAGADPASESSTRKSSPANTTGDEIPDDWLTGDNVSFTAHELSREPDEFDGPAPEAALPPRVGKPRKSRASQGAFVPAQGASEESPTPRRQSEKTASKRSERSAESASGWRHHLIWVLFLALIPLGISTVADGDPAEKRLEETLRLHPDAVPQLEQSKEEFFAAIPDHKLIGAHLPHGTWFHWGYAALSAILFLAFLTQTFPTSAAGPSRIFWTGLATGTAGILLLLAFQWVAMFTQGFNLRGRGIIVVLFYIIKFIGFSYRSALDPENGFLLSFMGFTCGVGLCEELCKALPVALFLRGNGHAGWKAACVVGLASGIGFGVSEGITYSSDSYNGIALGMTYLVRFASCVALHAMWAGAVAILMCQNQDYLGEFDWGNAGNFVLHYLGIAMVLHGLYDTLLKKEYEIWALAIAAISFAWFAWLVWRARSTA